MREIRFVIPGPLLGYRASISSRKNKDGTRSGGALDPKYRDYKQMVCYEAMAQGWKGRVASDRAWPVYLSVEVHWKEWARLDWSNCYKAVEDALFSNDRFVHPGRFSDFIQWKPEEKAIVVIQVEEKPGERDES